MLFFKTTILNISSLVFIYLIHKQGGGGVLFHVFHFKGLIFMFIKTCIDT